MASYYQTKREYATAEAKAYIRQREIEEQVRRANSREGNKVMLCGLTSFQWIDQYIAKRNALRNPPRPSKENGHDDEDRREATGTEAAEGRAGEGLGDPPQEQGGEAARGEGKNEDRTNHPSAFGSRLDDPGNEASWLDDAYPEGPPQWPDDGGKEAGSARWVREEDTPF